MKLTTLINILFFEANLITTILLILKLFNVIDIHYYYIPLPFSLPLFILITVSFFFDSKQLNNIKLTFKNENQQTKGKV